MQRRVITCIIALTLMLVFVLSMSASAYEYKRTSSSFRYIGDVLHEKSYGFFGGSGSFYVHGFGEVMGSHRVETTLYDISPQDFVYGTYPPQYTSSKAYIRVNLRGTTDPDYAATLAQREAELLAHVKQRREMEIAALNEKKKASPGMTGEEFMAEMDAINEFFDELVLDIIESYSEAKKNVRLLSSNTIDMKAGQARSRVGVDMDPGESGYIRQTIETSTGSQEYLRIRSSFENTGGTTKRELTIPEFFDERLHVEGYARVWERSTVREGNAKTGWWDTQP